MTTLDQLKILLNANSEYEHLEFKEAKTSMNFENGNRSILGYCVALANEKGGKLILGVTDKIPRQIVGTSAFPDFKKLERDIFRRFGRKVVVEELKIEGKRVLVVDVGSRPIAEPLSLEGKYLCRSRDELVPMSPDQLKSIYAEAVADFSAEVLPYATYDDIDQEAVANLRKLLKQSGRTEKKIDDFSDNQLLNDLNLVRENKLTVASIILLGKEQSVARLLPYAEIRYGYKTDLNEIRNQDTAIYQKGYLLYFNDIWNKINSRNLTLSIPQGLFITEKKAFEEESIREAINNALIHRDYQEKESIIIIQTQKDFMISNPGGLPEGITTENMIDRTKPRNKLIADVLQKCGFVETFGNGVNLMYLRQLELGKEPPNYSKTDKYHVTLELKGEIVNIRFTKYVYKVANDLNKFLNDEELRLLYQLQNEPKKLPSSKVSDLVRIGIIEKTYDDKYMLSKQYYEYADLKGEYTRRKGLDKETNKVLLLRHLENHKKGYKKDFIQVLKDVSPKTIEKYLEELRNENKIRLVGNPKITRGAERSYWILIKDLPK